MSFKDFQLLDNEPFDNSIIKRELTKIYNRQGDQLNQSNQNIDFISGENKYCRQIGNAHLEYDTTVWKMIPQTFIRMILFV